MLLLFLCICPNVTNNVSIGRPTKEEVRDIISAVLAPEGGDRQSAIRTIAAFVEEQMGLWGDDIFAPTTRIFKMFEGLPDATPGDLAAGVDRFLRDNTEYLLGKYCSLQRSFRTFIMLSPAEKGEVSAPGCSPHGEDLVQHLGRSLILSRSFR
jgi:hypothetical protein